jgi:hypothetical protein
MLNRMLRPQLFYPAFSLVGARHVVPSSPLAFSPVHSPSIILVPCRGAIHRVLFSVPFSVVPARFRRFRAAAGTSCHLLSPFPLFTRFRPALSLVGARHVVPSSPLVFSVVGARSSRPLLGPLFRCTGTIHPSSLGLFPCSLASARPCPL